MSEILQAAGMATPWLCGWLLLIFGFAPGFVLRVLVMLYPPDDERRAELMAELYAMRRIRRPMWVAEQIETALFEGPRQRMRRRGYRRRRQLAVDLERLSKRDRLTLFPINYGPANSIHLIPFLQLVHEFLVKYRARRYVDRHGCDARMDATLGATGSTQDLSTSGDAVVAAGCDTPACRDRLGCEIWQTLVRTGR